MKTIFAIWFEAKARYEQLQEDGSKKKVCDTFAVKADNFADAYHKACDYTSEELTSGEFEIIDEKVAPYNEVVRSDSINDDKYYRVKVVLVELNEKTNKEKATPVHLLIQAMNIEKARKYAEELYSSSMIDFSIKQVIETKIIDLVYSE